MNINSQQFKQTFGAKQPKQSGFNPQSSRNFEAQGFEYIDYDDFGSDRGQVATATYSSGWTGPNDSSSGSSSESSSNSSGSSGTSGSSGSSSTDNNAVDPCSLPTHNCYEPTNNGGSENNGDGSSNGNGNDNGNSSNGSNWNSNGNWGNQGNQGYNDNDGPSNTKCWACHVIGDDPYGLCASEGYVETCMIGHEYCQVEERQRGGQVYQVRMGCKQPQACSTNYFNNFRNATHPECDMGNEYGNDNISVCRQCCGGFDINGNSLQEQCNHGLLAAPYTTNDDWADNSAHGAVLTDSNGQNGFNPLAFASWMNQMIAEQNAAAAAAASEASTESDESAEEKSYASWNGNENISSSDLPYGFGAGLGDNYEGTDYAGNI